MTPVTDADSDVTPGVALAAPGVPRDVTPFQRAMWRAQRVAFVLQLGIVVAALLGAFGDGPLARVVVSDAASTDTLRYERAVRVEAPTTVAVSHEAGADGAVAVALSSSLVEALDGLHVVPTPRRALAGSDGYIWHTGASPRARVSLQLTGTPRSPGLLRGTVRIGQGRPMVIAMLVLP
ncbi:MAG: hypothetical protein MUF21_11700 [Gemmatimonadaceae bacterium]|jgi:hypothetical protein|nr:hypothetical protein [Gemmatimonadaceae bacterium]